MPKLRPTIFIMPLLQYSGVAPGRNQPPSFHQPPPPLSLTLSCAPLFNLSTTFQAGTPPAAANSQRFLAAHTAAPFPKEEEEDDDDYCEKCLLLSALSLFLFFCATSSLLIFRVASIVCVCVCPCVCAPCFLFAAQILGAPPPPHHETNYYTEPYGVRLVRKHRLFASGTNFAAL